MQAHLNKTESGTLRLHIGGEASHPDWKTLNVKQADYQQDARDLSNFDDCSVDAIYASHILEHFHYALGGELIGVLQQWYRVLKQDGEFFVSVPDLETLCHMYCEETRPEHRFHLMRIMYGGNMDLYDVHLAGFDMPILAFYLTEAGFRDINRVQSLGIFNDTSEQVLWGRRISLNVTARK